MRQYSLTLDEGSIPCPLVGGNPLTKYGQRWESLCPNKVWMITKGLLRVTATKQRANGLWPLDESFPSLSVTS